MSVKTEQELLKYIAAELDCLLVPEVLAKGSSEARIADLLVSVGAMTVERVESGGDIFFEYTQIV
jgi:hypothetical protein